MGIFERTDGPGLFIIVCISAIERSLLPSNAAISSTFLPSLGISVLAESNSVSYSLSILLGGKVRGCRAYLDLEAIGGRLLGAASLGLVLDSSIKLIDCMFMEIRLVGAGRILLLG